MKSNDEKENQCPELSTLSAYFDNELTPEERRNADHIQSCSDCKNHLSTFYQIDGAIKKSLAASVQDDLTQRILAGVHKKLEEEKRETISFKRPVFFNPIFLRVAASAVVCLGLVLYVVGRYNLKTDNAAQPHKITTVAQTAPGETIRFIDPSKAGYKVDDANGIPLNDFKTVKFGDASGKTNVTAALNNLKKPKYIRNNVRHVWVVNNLDNVKNDIEQFAASNNIPENKLKLTPNYRGSGLQLNMRLTKRQLVNLVNKCNNEGFSLVTDQAPAPNEKLFIGKQSAPVQYNAEFVLAN